MPEEQRARLREVDRLRNARGLRAEGSLTQDEEDTHDILTNIAIQRARAAALEYLHRTQVEGNDDSVHQAHVCVVCDCFILGTEILTRITKQQLQEHKERLSVTKYEEFQGKHLHPNVVRYYHLRGFPGMLLSPRANHVEGKGYSCCATCKNSMTPRYRDKKAPRFSIANGFAIGELLSCRTSMTMVKYKSLIRR